MRPRIGWSSLLRWGRLLRMIVAVTVLVVIGAVDGMDRAAAQGSTVNVRDFPSLQAAVDSVRQTGGAVYVPAGEYTLPAKLRLYSNTAVFGDGMDRTVLRLASGVVDHLVSNNSNSTHSTNITLRDLTLSGPGVNVGSGSCCFGLRFINVSDSTVVNVAADNFRLEGFYFGYFQQNGVNNVRLSGCRATGNGRSGMAITHGNGNIVDNCRFANNNRNEPVAGLDLEPDEGLDVSGNKVVGNTASGQNVGIQLFRPFRDYAGLANNAICSNTATGNVSAGIYDLKGTNNIYVSNSTSGNGTDFLVDPSALIGSAYAGSCTLPALPAPPSPPAPPTPNCSPRPRVNVSTVAAGSGRIQVTISSTTNAGGPQNLLQALRFQTLTGALVDLNGQTYAANNSVATFSPEVQQATFFVRRAPGAGAATAQIVVRDRCGDWPTFVGLGPAV